MKTKQAAGKKITEEERERMVDWMVEDDISMIMNHGSTVESFLYAVLRGEGGWVPYNNRTDAQVAAEYKERVK